MNSFEQDIMPQTAPRKKISLSKAPRGSVRSRPRGKVSLAKNPENGIYISPTSTEEISFPEADIPTAQAPVQAHNSVVSAGAISGGAPPDPLVTAARENRGLYIRKGHFRCAYNAEFAFLLIAAIAGAALILGFAVSTLSSLFDSGSDNDLYDYFYEIGIFIIACIFTFILYGRSYHFSAEKDVFIVSRRNKKEYFYYCDIDDVRFEIFSLFGIKRGYIVTVVTKYRTETYRLIFGKNRIFTDATNTPFYYLMRNTGLTDLPENNTPILKGVQNIW